MLQPFLMKKFGTKMSACNYDNLKGNVTKEVKNVCFGPKVKSNNQSHICGGASMRLYDNSQG